MKAIFRFLVSGLVFGLVFGVSSCGKDSGGGSGEEVQLFGQAAHVYSGKDLNISEQQLSGSGSIIFVEPVASNVSANRSFSFSFTLQDQSSVQLSAFTPADDLTKGVEVTVARTGSKATLSIGAKVVAELNGISDDSKHQVTVDVHNSEGHILVWHNQSEEFDEDTAWWHSEMDGVEFSEDELKGSGMFWALAVANATIHSASVDHEKLEHHHHD